MPSPQTEQHEGPEGRDDARATRGGLSRGRKAAIGALALIIVVAVVGLVAYDAGSDEVAFHDIEFETLGGEAASFAPYAGRPVVLNFFASWCGPCVAEMPTLDVIHRDLGDELTVVGLAFEGARPAADIVARTGVTYPTGLDTDGVLLERFDGFGMPTTVFVDGDGRVVDTHIGALTETALRARLAQLFGIGDV